MERNFVLDIRRHDFKKSDLKLTF